MYAVLFTGLCNSMIFPIIFSEGLSMAGNRRHIASGILLTANLGGALTPLLQGIFADSLGIQVSFALPAVYYLLLFLYVRLQRVDHLPLAP